ncbi:MAG: prepilin-type N-terminal cleavage/methylation domain-containing protein [Phycisphaerales bacterium]
MSNAWTARRLEPSRAADLVQQSGRDRRATRRRARGFTLMETALATVIIAVGVLALIEAQAAFTSNNEWSTASATATYMANELRERMRTFPRHDPVNGLYLDGNNALQGWGAEDGELDIVDFDDLDDLDGKSFGTGGMFDGPVDSTGHVIMERGPDGLPLLGEDGAPIPLRGWRQRVVVEKVDPQNFNTVRAASYVRPAVGQTPGLNVDQFPLRVSVIIEYTPPGEYEAREMAKVVWIAP